MIIFVIGYFGYQKIKDNKEQEITTETVKQERESTVKDFIDKYNALVDWDELINYTIQLQDSIAGAERPIFFMGYIDDIFEKDEKYFIRFRTDFLTSPEIIFILQVDYGKISGILDGQELEEDGLFGFLNNYAVVANIDEINKLNLQITGYPDGAEEVTLEYAPADIYIAAGECVDFIYIGSIFDYENL